MNTVPVLRPASNADGKAVEELIFSVLREFGLKPDPGGVDADLADLEGHYQRTGGLFDVLVDGSGTIVGTVGLLPLDSTTCELRKMYLRPDQRGHGQGRRLLDHALAEARRRGFARMTLETASPLKTAIALYRRTGFLPIAHEGQAARCDLSLQLDLNAPGRRG